MTAAACQTHARGHFIVLFNNKLLLVIYFLLR